MGRSVMGGARWPLSFSQLSGIMAETRDVTEGQKCEACVKPGVEMLQRDLKWSQSHSHCVQRRGM